MNRVGSFVWFALFDVLLPLFLVISIFNIPISYVLIGALVSALVILLAYSLIGVLFAVRLFILWRHEATTGSRESGSV